MKIANPIYDAVFKYMMNDNKVAKLLLSAIIGEEILELEFRPTEHNIPLKESITVFRMDFSALVKYKDQTQQLIIIEIQKAKLPADIMRFRKYLGKQYLNPNNTIKDKQEEGTKKALPILSIYFLGHALEYTKNIPVIKVERNYYDLATGNVLNQKEEFIESLTHDSYIIQIPFLKGKMRNELEKVLSIFDQSNIDADYHILNIKENQIPEQYRPIIRRLITAIAEAEVREYMEAEDDLIEEMQSYTRLIQEKENKLIHQQQEIEEKEQVIEEKEQVIEEKKQVIEEKEQVIEEKKQVIEEKEQVIKQTKSQLKEQQAQLDEQAKLIKSLKKQLKK